jgi:nucleoside-diphosphate-sugar epimerase
LHSVIRCSRPRPRGGRRRFTATAETRDFTYVTNVVDGVIRACDAPTWPASAINVDRREYRSMNCSA